ncbi:hypothetical protein J5N97_027195 [Dioscorea zingiberensis]|uniref:Uncharacterized protein n=1 Tax=Dioscorea zingiberensis TaxID=325984 RepID=A0A9D5C4U3_9LILI|nr:hypothetical protein J5N97_027195 [Dioscorea zingiberensis]
MPEAPKTTTIPEEHRKALEFIEDVTTNAGEVQNRVLSEILKQNSEVEYLHRHGLNGCIDIAAFKRIMPMVKYEDLQPDIFRIANGDKSPILCARPISEFLTSLMMPVMNQYVPGLEMGKGMYLLFVKSEARTPGGLLARPALTSYYKSRHFMIERPLDPYNIYTSPNEAILCPDSFQSMYSQLLCGLLENTQVLRVGAVFASGFIRAIHFLEKNWPRLASDILTGTLDAKITDRDVREAVMKVLKPNPSLAGFIEAECRKESWQGIIPRLWPNTKYVDVIVTGAMSQYIPTLDFYSGGLPLACTLYASSECYFGLNLNPMRKPSEVSYTLIPTMGYFEFLPMHRSNSTSDEPADHHDLVDLVDVKLGQEYELVVTTYAGLYRYRVGDVLKVAGFKNKAPQFNFIGRKNVALSIEADKTDEVELHAAVNKAVNYLEPFGATLSEYTSYADTTTIPGHYVYEDCCLAIEESLNSVYRQGRAADGSIGPLELKIVEEGTFDKLMDYALSQGASINQYKAPRCVKAAPIVQLLNSKVLSCYFSPKCPKWIPGHKQWMKEN